MSDEARQRLADQQAAMVQSLLAGAPPPEGTDPAQVERSAKSLAGKRRRELEKSLPMLREQQRDIGLIIDRYLAEFAVPPADRRTDVARLVKFMLKASALSDLARLELLRGLLRPGRPARMLWLSRPARIAVAIQLPWIGRRVAQLRLFPPRLLFP
jgi:hypothetical protein